VAQILSLERKRILDDLDRALERGGIIRPTRRAFVEAYEEILSAIDGIQVNIAMELPGGLTHEQAEKVSAALNKAGHDARSAVQANMLKALECFGRKWFGLPLTQPDKEG
jgi:hypothetical protein